MNNMIKVLLVVFISFLSSPSWSETVSMDDLVWRDALWCKKFTDVPFTGEVSGKDNGKIKNGNLQDLWIFYYNSGQLYLKTNYKDGNRQGLMEYYSSENGSLLKTHI